MTVSISTWNGHNINDGTNYNAWIEESGWRLPPYSVVTSQREGRAPVVSKVDQLAHYFLIGINIIGSGVAAKRTQLRQWFDPTDETPYQLIVTGDAGNTQYIEAVCEEFVAESSAGITFLVYLKVHDDTAWRKNTATTPSAWNITTSASTNGYTNSGEFDAYPTYTITPTSAKTGTNPYKKFIAVHWKAAAVTSYPTDIGNDSLDTRTASTNFASAAGDDIRVYVDGSLVDYWLDGPNTATTKVWCNLNWKKGKTVTLESALGTGSIETLDVNEDISEFDDKGILQIESEFFIYTAKNVSLKRFTIASRAAYASTAATHAADTSVLWIQHEIILTYGSASLSAYTVDANYQPIFNLTNSTNTSWDYDNFGEDDGLRTGAWKKGPEFAQLGGNYTANHNTNADPWSEIGAYQDLVGYLFTPYFYMFNPCGITTANFQNGEKYASFGVAQWKGKIKSGVVNPISVTEYTIPGISTATSWIAWSSSVSLTAGSKYVSMFLDYTYGGAGTGMYIEAADVTLSLNTSSTPAVTLGVEDGNYNLDATITNNTTGYAISVSLQMDTSQSLTINTWDGTVTYNKDGSSQYGAVTRLGGPRTAWLALQPGSNVLQFDDSGTGNVTIGVSYNERYGA